MKQLSCTKELKEVSHRIIWFENPEKALSDPIRFIAYAMTYGTHEDMKIVREYLTDDDLIESLDKAPPGIFDGRSWAYWNLKMDRYPTPPMPTRRFD